MEKLIDKPEGLMYDGFTFAEEDPDLGGNTVEGDPFTYAPRVWDYLIDRFVIRSMLDLGSGLGHSSEYFFRRGVRVIAVEGLSSNIQGSIYPAIQVDIRKEKINCKVDLVHCQELVEHIEEEFLKNLLRSLTTGKIILLTNALPEQGGHHHVNEQPTQYWIDQLALYDCHVLVEDTNRIRRIAETDGAQYLVRTGTVFANRKRF
jgi:SAM-dependent methyltransferase